MLKLGSVPFLNAKPLIYPIEDNLLDHNFELHYYDPSLLSKKLKDKSVDIGLIPVGELVTQDEYLVVPDISISSFGKVDSVILKSICDVKDIKTVAVDNRSQSSTALMKVIFEVFYNITPEYIKRNIDSGFMNDVDAGMLIGDAGLQALYSDSNEFEIFDLGELWTNFTGLPFVYAVFAVNTNNDFTHEIDNLIRSKEIGQSRINEIVDSEYEKIGLTTEQCALYLTERIKYNLGPKELEGLSSYSNYLYDLKLIDKKFKLKLFNS